MNYPVKVQTLYSPAQGKPPNVEKLSSTLNIFYTGLRYKNVYLVSNKN